MPWLLVGLVGGLASLARAQAPGLLWTTNFGGARLFAVDAQTNLYANNGGAVLTFNSAGELLSSNNICPLPGVAQRGSDGSFYFAGSLDGTQDFGGITLVGGYIEGRFGWTPGWPDIFVAKYSSSGSLLWATKTGINPAKNLMGDLSVNADGNLAVAYFTSAYSEGFAIYSAAGSNLWSYTPQSLLESYGTVTLTAGPDGRWVCSCYVNLGQLRVRAFNASGTFLAGGSGYCESGLAANGRAILGATNDIYMAFCPFGAQQLVLRKAVSGAVAWDRPLDFGQWIVGTDRLGYLYLARTNACFSKYDREGSLIWTANYGSPVIQMLDAQGSRYITTADGSISRLQSDPDPLPILRGAQFGSAGFQLTLSSQTQTVWQIRVSSDLSNWDSLGFATNLSGEVQFIDPAPPSGSRFYKAVSVP